MISGGDDGYIYGSVHYWDRRTGKKLWHITNRYLVSETLISVGLRVGWEVADGALMNGKGTQVEMMGIHIVMAQCITGTEEWVKSCGILLVGYLKKH